MPPVPTHSIVETTAFTGQARRLEVTAEEMATLYDTYAANPSYGQIVRGTGGLRKGRISKSDTGKSGGYRVFSFFADERDPVFFLWIIDKSEDETLTDAQENAFKRLTSQLKKELRNEGQ
ncbi:type II toxin-antitoxin system RelE/ParE family toxin [Labrys okinawensis]|uniref:type II toxin-antitoxin system RelE/ParE family toxin n=1 Tax=Labrys okinawensis TaxID=346911 RepID=UPI0039BC3FF0